MSLYDIFIACVGVLNGADVDEVEDEDDGDVDLVVVVVVLFLPNVSIPPNWFELTLFPEANAGDDDISTSTSSLLLLFRTATICGRVTVLVFEDEDDDAMLDCGVVDGDGVFNVSPFICSGNRPFASGPCPSGYDSVVFSSSFPVSG